MKTIKIDFWTIGENDFNEVVLVPNDVTEKDIQKEINKDKKKSQANGSCYDTEELEHTLSRLKCVKTVHDDSWNLEW